MAVTTSNDREIEYLLKREFPGYWATQPQPITRHTARVPITREQEQARDALRQRIDRRRSELFLLRLTASNEFAALVAAEYAKEAQAAEDAQPFNQPHARANFDHWGKLAYWSLDESIALCFGRNPRIAGWEAVRKLVNVSPFAKQFADAREIAIRAVGVNEITQSNIPGPFIAWAKRVGLPFPPELEAKVAERGPIVDWRSAYERDHANLEAAGARIAELTRELDAARDRAPNRAPQPSEKAVDARERTTMLRIIRALSVIATLPDRGATSSVQLQLEKLGFTGTPKDAAIRKVLADARALEPDSKPQ